MTTREQGTGATPVREPNFGNRRRPQVKDTLMPDEPPKVLGLAIPVIAVLFVLLFVTLRFVEYQDAVRVSLTLKTRESFGRAYGEVYVPQSDASAIRPEQVVDIDLGAYGGTNRPRLQARVRDVAVFDVTSFYRVQVDLPADFDLHSLSTAPPGPIQVEAKILTQKKTLFDKLFGAFRVMSRDL